METIPLKLIHTQRRQTAPDMGMFLLAEGPRRLDHEALGELELSSATILKKIPRQVSRAPWTIPIDAPIGMPIGWGIADRYLLSPAIGG